jgi:hypothetical protein
VGKDPQSCQCHRCGVSANEKIQVNSLLILLLALLMSRKMTLDQLTLLEVLPNKFVDEILVVVVT